MRWLTPAGVLEARHRRRIVDLSPVEVLRAAPVERLKDRAFLECEILPRLGLTEEAPEDFPPELHAMKARGLRIFQYPNQLSPYLVALAGLPIRSYLELGVLDGGTFIVTVEYLRRFDLVERATAIDIGPMLAVERYATRAHGVEAIRLASGTPAFDALVRERAPDLVLIDADHSLAAVRRDFASVVPHARAIAFHDISHNCWPGVRQVWDSFRAEQNEHWDFQEFTAQYQEVTERMGGTLFGIGLAVRKDLVHEASVSGHH